VVTDDTNEYPCPNDSYDFYLNGYASDYYNLPLTYIVVTPPAHGTLINEGSGEFLYTPTNCYEGADIFTFKVNDGLADSNIGTVTLTMGDVVSTSYSPGAAQTCKNTPLPITLSASDNWNGNSCSDPSTFIYTVLANPTNGVLTGTAPYLTYTPTNATFTGMDSFTYEVTTSCGNSATNTVTITVGDPNISTDSQTAMTGTNQPLNLVLTAEDSDSCAEDSFTYTIVDSPTNGSAAITGTNCLYTPNPGFEGVDNFIFTASDGVWTSSYPASVTLFVLAGPANLTAQCVTNGAGILLNWSLDSIVQQMEASDGFNIYNFEIYRSATHGGPYTNISTVWNSSQTTYVDLDAAPGQTYYYRVKFSYQDPYTYTVYESPYSSEAALTTCCPVNDGNALWVDYGPTPLQLAQWLMGTNHVTITNATYTGAETAIGIFGNGSAVCLPTGAPGLPIDAGVILASGDIANAIGPNDSSRMSTPFYEDIPGISWLPKRRHLVET
jgi:hypothetical protein